MKSYDRIQKYLGYSGSAILWQRNTDAQIIAVVHAHLYMLLWSANRFQYKSMVRKVSNQTGPKTYIQKLFVYHVLSIVILADKQTCLSTTVRQQ